MSDEAFSTICKSGHDKNECKDNEAFTTGQIVGFYDSFFGPVFCTQARKSDESTDCSGYGPVCPGNYHTLITIYKWYRH